MTDLRTRRYTMPVIRRAKELAEAGWTPTEIAKVLQREHGVSPHRETIHVWVDDEYAAHRRGLHRRIHNKQFLLRGRSLEYRAAFIRELDRAGVSISEIGKVCGVVLGADLADEELWAAIDGVAA